MKKNLKGSPNVSTEAGTVAGSTVPSPSPRPSPQGRGGAKVAAVLVQVAPGKVRASGTNPRKVFGAAELGELTESVRQHGVVQPLVVRRVAKWELAPPDLVSKEWRVLKDGKEGFCFDTEKEARGKLAEVGAVSSPSPRPSPQGRGGLKGSADDAGSAVEYELVAGERRWRAARAAGLATIPVMVMELTDAEVIEVQYLENLQRVDLSVLEEAEGFAALIKSGKYTAESLAVKLGKSRSHVFGRLKLCKLSAAVRTEMERGNLDATAAGLIASVPDAKDQEKLVNQATKGRWGDGPMSFRDLKELIARQYQKNLSGAPWKLDDAVLVKTAGACQWCPKRSGNMVGFEGGPNVCTDLKCWEVKQAAWSDRRVKEGKAAGLEVVKDWEATRNRHNSPFIDPDDETYLGKEYQSFRKALGKELPAVAGIGLRQDGTAVDLVKREELLALVKKKFPRQRNSSGGGDASWKREEAKRRAEALLQGKVERAALVLIRKKARSGSGPKFWELIARMLLAAAHWDPIQAMLKDRELKPGGASAWNDRARPLRESLGDEESRREAVVELLAREGDNLKAAAEWAGVDLKEVEKEVAREKAKTKAGRTVCSPSPRPSPQGRGRAAAGAAGGGAGGAKGRKGKKK